MTTPSPTPAILSPSPNATLPSGNADEYMTQLDSLRAIAVLGVCLHHWTGDKWLGNLPLDSGRVQLFFALSGFLITMILLKARARAEAAGDGIWGVLRAFYVRRVLRIWPLFFVVLAVTAALNLKPSREWLLWNGTFQTNFRIFQVGDLKAVGIVAHFWSLAVEEQFYLLWPWLVLLVPRKALVLAMVVLAVLCNAIQVIVRHRTNTDVGVNFLPSACVNTIVYGSILAVYREHPKTDKIATILGLFVGLPLAAVIWVLNDHFDVLGPFGTPLQRVTLAFFLGWLLLKTARGWRGPIGYVLELKPLLWIGTVSFGIYLIHNFPETFLRDYVVTRAGVPKGISQPLRSVLAILPLKVLMLFAITISLSALAYYSYERPVNRLKRFFPYTRKKSQTGKHNLQPSSTDHQARVGSPAHDDVARRPAAHTLAHTAS